MHPVAYSARYEGEGRSRLSVFFRMVLVIPWFIVGFFYGIGVLFAVIVAWFALLITGRYPEGLYNFNAGVVRFGSRLNGFTYLLTDEFPSFGLEDDFDYPVRTLIEPPKESYSRLKILFRFILIIPVAILNYVMSIIVSLMSLVAWFVLVFTAKLPEGLYKPLRAALAYSTKASAYELLLTEDFPPFWMDEAEEAPRFEGGAASTAFNTPPPPPAPAV